MSVQATDAEGFKNLEQLEASEVCSHTHTSARDNGAGYFTFDYFLGSTPGAFETKRARYFRGFCEDSRGAKKG